MLRLKMLLYFYPSLDCRSIKGLSDCRKIWAKKIQFERYFKVIHMILVNDTKTCIILLDKTQCLLCWVWKWCILRFKLNFDGCLDFLTIPEPLSNEIRLIVTWHHLYAMFRSVLWHAIQKQKHDVPITSPRR